MTNETSKPLYKVDFKSDANKTAAENYQALQAKMQEIQIFTLMVEKFVSDILVNDIGNFVTNLIPVLLNNPAFQQGLSDAISNNPDIQQSIQDATAASSAASSAALPNDISTSINSPTNSVVKQALASYLLAYFNLPPTTPIP